jgi:hypothetical protein
MTQKKFKEKLPNVKFGQTWFYSVQVVLAMIIHAMVFGQDPLATNVATVLRVGALANVY